MSLKTMEPSNINSDNRSTMRRPSSLYKTFSFPSRQLPSPHPYWPSTYVSTAYKPFNEHDFMENAYALLLLSRSQTVAQEPEPYMETLAPILCPPQPIHTFSAYAYPDDSVTRTAEEMRADKKRTKKAAAAAATKTPTTTRTRRDDDLRMLLLHRLHRRSIHAHC